MDVIKKEHELENGRKYNDIQPKRCSDYSSMNKPIYIEEILTKIGFGKFNYIIIFVSGMLLNAQLMETLGMTLVIPVSQCDLNLSSSEKGILGAVAFLGIICSSHLWGYLSDTKGRRRVIRPTLIIACILGLCSSFSQNFLTFAILRFLNGFFICASSSTMYAYLGEFHNNAQRARAIMGSAVIFGSSGLLLPLVGWWVINQDWSFYIPLLDLTYKPWRLFVVVCAIPGLFCVTALSFLPESPKFVLAQGNQKQTIEILEKINRWNNGSIEVLDIIEISEEAESIENRRRILDSKPSRFPILKSIWHQTAPLFKSSYIRPTLLICTIQFITYYTSNGLFMFFPDILNRVAVNLPRAGSQSMSMCQLVNMVPVNSSVQSNKDGLECVTELELEMLQQDVVTELIHAIGFIIIGLLINRIGKFNILITLLLFSSACGFLCVYIYIPFVFTSAFIGVMCCGMAINVMNAATVEIYPTSFRTMAVSISLLFGRLGAVTGSNLTALLIENHCDSVFLLTAFSLIGNCILVFFVPKIHEKLSKKSDIGKEPRASIISRT